MRALTTREWRRDSKMDAKELERDWKTTNIHLWLSNDQAFCDIATYAETYAECVCIIKDIFLDAEGEGTPDPYWETPDGVMWTDSDLDTARLDAVVRDISDD